MNIQTELKQSIHAAISTLGFAVSLEEIQIDPCANPVFGDYSSNIAMQLYKKNTGKVPGKKEGDPLILNGVTLLNPRELADRIVQEMEKLSPIRFQLSTAFPGFINFTLDSTVFTHLLTAFSGANFDFSTDLSHKVAIVEYSSPNIAKPFTVGHLRSTIIGDVVARLLEKTGFDVKRDNHLGDWGTQFGKLIVAIKELGEEWESSNIERITTSPEPVKKLVELYVEFHEKAESDPSLEEKARAWFTKLEQGDEEARSLWRLCIDWSWQEFNKIYTELGVSFTENNKRGYGESFFEDKMTVVVEELEKSGYLKEGKEGAKLFFFPNDELPPLMILKNDGSTLYATRDLATDKFRLAHYGSDILVINEVGAEQELYFRQLYRIEALLGWYSPGQRVHVKHGHFRFKDGKMSTRKGNVIWLEDVIAEAKRRARELSTHSEPQVAQAVAIGAIKWNDLKRAANLDITFDWDEILAMEGNSGPYLQYTAVRCKSIVGRAKEAGLDTTLDGHLSVELDTQERSLARQFLYFEDVVRRAANEYAPHHLCTYLYTLAGEFNSFYNTHKVLDGSGDQTKRLTLTIAVLNVLTEGLEILGIAVPDKM